MAATADEVRQWAEEAIGEYRRSHSDTGHHGVIKAYLAGEHNLPYAPEGARAEYKSMAIKSITNWLPLFSDTYTKALWVDDYLSGSIDKDGNRRSAAAWDWWRLNGLDARQTVAHRGALEYGASYVLVLPGDKAPLIRPLPAARSMAWYEDEDDEWPVRGLLYRGKSLSGAELWALYDSQAVYEISEGQGSTGPNRFSLDAVMEHGLGVTPLVRFRDRLDGPPVGIIRPLIPMQDRLNETVFAWSMALHMAAFRQRWATGLAIPVDESPTMEEVNPDFDESQPLSEENQPTITVPNPGYKQPIETFDQAVDRLWTTQQETAKFGEFGQTTTGDHKSTYESIVHTMAAIAQLPPSVLTGEISNVSADALASIYDNTTRRIGEYKTIFGEGWEQVMRLAGVAAGKRAAAQDTKSRIHWRDTEVRSLAALMDALGKAVQMVGMPQEAAMEQLPWGTAEDRKRWSQMEPRQDSLTQLASALNRQQAPNAQADPNADKSAPAGA